VKGDLLRRGVCGRLSEFDISEIERGEEMLMWQVER
jgi:hypothetical protein